MPLDDKAGHVPFDPHEEHPRLSIDMLIEVQDIAAVGEDEIGNGGDQALLIGAGDQQNRGIRCVGFSHHEFNQS